MSACDHKFVASFWYWDSEKEALPPMWLICARCNEKRLFLLSAVQPSAAEKVAAMYRQTGAGQEETR